MNSLNDNSTNTSRKHKRHFTLFDKTDSSIPGGGITYIIAFVIPLIIMTAVLHSMDSSIHYSYNIYDGVMSAKEKSMFLNKNIVSKRY